MRNLSALEIPKYDNIVPSSDMFDKDTYIQIPRSLLVTERSIGKRDNLSLYFSIYVNRGRTGFRWMDAQMEWRNREIGIY